MHFGAPQYPGNRSLRRRPEAVVRTPPPQEVRTPLPGLDRPQLDSPSSAPVSPASGASFAPSVSDSLRDHKELKDGKGCEKEDPAFRSRSDSHASRSPVIRTPRLALAVIRTRRAQAPVDLPLTTQTLARVEYEEGGWCVLA